MFRSDKEDRFDNDRSIRKVQYCRNLNSSARRVSVRITYGLFEQTCTSIASILILILASEYSTASEWVEYRRVSMSELLSGYLDTEAAPPFPHIWEFFRYAKQGEVALQKGRRIRYFKLCKTKSFATVYTMNAKSHLRVKCWQPSCFDPLYIFWWRFLGAGYSLTQWVSRVSTMSILSEWVISRE